ncbi:MAG: hypothetical protein KF770_01995 [Anaerolineae bacterium]|nr:hypothetical protein [Anaerolineae bacterium]
MNVLLPPAALTAVRQEELYLYLQLIAVFTLLLLLIGRELTIGLKFPYARWRRVSLVGIVPLLFAFLLILMWHIVRSM